MYFMDTEIAWAVFLWTGRWKCKLQYLQLDCDNKDLLEKSIATLYSFYKAQKIKDILPKTPLTLFWLANFGKKNFPLRSLVFTEMCPIWIEKRLVVESFSVVLSFWDFASQRKTSNICSGIKRPEKAKCFKHLQHLTISQAFLKIENISNICAKSRYFEHLWREKCFKRLWQIKI